MKKEIVISDVVHGIKNDTVIGDLIVWTEDDLV